MSTLLLNAQNVSWRIGGRTLFSGIDFSVHTGEALELRGPNGSGKSTLLRLLAKFQQPHEGSVKLNTRRVGFLGHKPGLSGLLSVFENVKWYCTLAKAHFTDTELEERLHQFELTHEKHTLVQELSTGQVRRCALLCLCLAQYDLWLLDEPTAALDSRGTSVTQNLIEQHRKNSGAVVMATHSTEPLSEATTVELNGT